MCILFIYRNPEASTNSYKFILASNRDEYFCRPAQQAHFWNDDSQSIGGKDMEPGKEGGTWLAASLKGRVGVILNLSNESKEARKGRGFLVSEYISSSDSTLTFLEKLHQINQKQQLYNPYNLVVAEMKSASVYCLSSYENASGAYSCEDHILGFGNSRFIYPYKKVKVGKEQFKDIVINASQKQKDQLIQKLIKFLKSSEKHLPDEELYKRSPTSFTDLSSIFVNDRNAKYGTRTHTIVLVDNNNQLTFVEDTLMPDGKWYYQTFEAMLVD